MQTLWILIIPFAVLRHIDNRIAARMANIAVFEGLRIPYTSEKCIIMLSGVQLVKHTTTATCDKTCTLLAFVSNTLFGNVNSPYWCYSQIPLANKVNNCVGEEEISSTWQNHLLNSIFKDTSDKNSIRTFLLNSTYEQPFAFRNFDIAASLTASKYDMQCGRTSSCTLYICRWIYFN